MVFLVSVLSTLMKGEAVKLRSSVSTERTGNMAVAVTRLHGVFMRHPAYNSATLTIQVQELYPR